MATNQISGVSPRGLSMVDAKASKDKNELKNKENDFTAGFLSMMSQGMQTKQETFTVDDAKKVDLDQQYSMKQSNASTDKIPMTKEADVSEKLEDCQEELEQLEQDILSAVCEKLDVNEEEVLSILETLGISVAELLEPQKLMNFVMTLTGEDVGNILSDESFRYLMDEISQIGDIFFETVGIDREEFKVLFEQGALEQADLQKQEPLIEVQVEAPVESEKDLKATQINEVTIESKEILGENVEDIPDDSVKTKEITLDTKETKETAVEKEENIPIAKAGEATEEENMGDSTEEHDSNSSSLNHQSLGGELVSSQATNRLEQTSETFTHEFVNQWEHQVNVEDLMEQFVRNVKLTVASDTTSMEMQLHPEHLGKLLLNVSEKDGVIRAQITTQNQLVKEALESQIVELRQTLQQQGIKVEAVEVTVETHEFEENLEKQAMQEQQMKEQQEQEQKKHAARRNLNASELEEISELMSEEETLAARMMLEQGNQVDYTA